MPLFSVQMDVGPAGEPAAGEFDHLATHVHAVNFAKHFGQRSGDPARAAANLENLHLLGVPALADVGHVVEDFLLHGLAAESAELLVGPLFPLGEDVEPGVLAGAPVPVGFHLPELLLQRNRGHLRPL